MHIGIAGIGNMGSNIGARLMEVGHTLTVWNRTAEKTKPLADAGAGVAKTPAELDERGRGGHQPADRHRRDRCGLSRAAGPARRRRQGQAVHRDEHGDAGGAGRAGREGARQGRGLRRMPGQRIGHSGAGGQAARADGRGARRRRARAAAARADVPARDARRAGRLRRAAQARRQPAADDLLAGARRAAFAVQDADDRSGGASGFPRPRRRARPPCSSSGCRASSPSSRRSRRDITDLHASTAASRTSSRCWRRARSAASNCRC